MTEEQAVHPGRLRQPHSHHRPTVTLEALPARARTRHRHEEPDHEEGRACADDRRALPEAPVAEPVVSEVAVGREPVVMADVVSAAVDESGLKAEVVSVDEPGVAEVMASREAVVKPEVVPVTDADEDARMTGVPSRVEPAVEPVASPGDVRQEREEVQPSPTAEITPSSTSPGRPATSASTSTPAAAGAPIRRRSPSRWSRPRSGSWRAAGVNRPRMCLGIDPDRQDQGGAGAAGRDQGEGRRCERATGAARSFAGIRSTDVTRGRWRRGTVRSRAAE